MPCSANLCTFDLETEVFLHVLNNCLEYVQVRALTAWSRAYGFSFFGSRAQGQGVRRERPRWLQPEAWYGGLGPDAVGVCPTALTAHAGRRARRRQPGRGGGARHHAGRRRHVHQVGRARPPCMVALPLGLPWGVRPRVWSAPHAIAARAHGQALCGGRLAPRSCGAHAVMRCACADHGLAPCCVLPALLVLLPAACPEASGPTGWSASRRPSSSASRSWCPLSPS